MVKFLVVSMFILLSSVSVVHAEVQDNNLMDELDPYAENIYQQLEEMDQEYFEQTGQLPFLNDDFSRTDLLGALADCVKEACPIYVKIVKSEQKLYLWENGQLTQQWLVSTGVEGRGTPNMDLHPNGRIYDRYTSTKFPEGDWKGLGNMPYAVFLRDGFAIHGTTAGNIKRLGKRASHGCIRIHPDNGLIFNRLVRQYGVRNVWVTITN